MGRPGLHLKPSTKPLFGPWATGLVAALLVVPFAIHYVLDTEPYPAVIFPSGASIATHIIDDRPTFVVPVLVGFDQDGNPVELSSTLLLDPIPPSHLSGLIRTGFGQDETPTVRRHSHRLDWGFEHARYVASEEERLEVRHWLAGKLEDAGLDPDRLLVRHDRLAVDYSTGEVLTRETVDEVVVL